MKSNCKVFEIITVLICTFSFLMGSCTDTTPNNNTDSQKLPELSTITDINNITCMSAICGGIVTSDNGKPVTVRGMCWSINPKPTIAISTKTSDGTGIGSFTSSLTGLSINTRYYVRSYATNANGTSYGNEVSFTTQNGVIQLSSSVIAGIAVTSVSIHCNITTDGGSAIMERGVCWDTKTSPTVALSTKTIDGVGIGLFTSTIKELTFGTTYYIRSYATNNIGTVYGQQITYIGGMGSNYQGGIVFYIDSTGHGLVCAPYDQGTRSSWDKGIHIETGTTAYLVGTGNANTNTIVNRIRDGSYAARLCYDLELNTYSDWYLPSSDELNLMYINLQINGWGSFAREHYWSSSEDIGSSWYARYQDFGNGLQDAAIKDESYHVRAVRSF